MVKKHEKVITALRKRKKLGAKKGVPLLAIVAKLSANRKARRAKNRAGRNNGDFCGLSR